VMAPARKLRAVPTAAVKVADSRSGSAPTGVAGWIAKRSSQWNLSGPDERLMRAQSPLWNLLMDHYFRMEMPITTTAVPRGPDDRGYPVTPDSDRYATIAFVSPRRASS
jgi:hypothetical protein